MHYRPIKWWQRPSWLAALASLVAALSFAAFVIDAHYTRSDVDAIERQQDDITELVTFVRDLQQEQDDDPDRVGQGDLQIFVDLLCSSTDPARLAFCEAHGLLPKE
jgi:hypothetical protein